MKTNIRTAPSKPSTAIKKGFLSNKMKELKKNKTKDSSWTLISILTTGPVLLVPTKETVLQYLRLVYCYLLVCIALVS